MAQYQEKKAVHFGAGAIGRGFLGELYHKSGYEIVFADVVDSLITSLQTTKKYEVTEVGTEGEKKFEVSNYRAINSKTHEAEVVRELSTAGIVTCAVGPNVLKFIAPVIAKGIDARPAGIPPLAVIACENAIGATDTLAAFIKDGKNTPAERLGSIADRARFANSAVDRIVPVQEANAGLNVKIESYYEWVVDQRPFADVQHPPVNGVRWVQDLTPYIERKLFTVNTGHAATAYYGHYKGKKTIHEALEDRDIHDKVRAVLQETSKLITTKHDISEQEQSDYVKKIITRISNPALEDVVERVGRAPLRKLSRKERFIGPAAELVDDHDPVDALLFSIQMAFRFQNVPGDDESAQLATIMAENEPAAVVEKVCGLEKAHPLFAMVVKAVEKVQAETK
ncbi:MAG: hypothetical protein M1826_006050 [Phylliscum demangeonii]|nr:MAG: hypothetical protein M1826_006050 [Phylliscum demangeonii]